MELTYKGKKIFAFADTHGAHILGKVITMIFWIGSRHSLAITEYSSPAITNCLSISVRQTESDRCSQSTESY